ncbi:hypothetical protein NicSoilE8_27230 [Arthrobacter sp. NicSoilE8]|nr:hypothetical protein NicSoilE8_27230 [Arthrobacter sp. NicSoilE8]
MTRSAASYESEIRYWRDMALRLNQQLSSLNNIPENHKDRGIHRDPVGNYVSARIDRQRKRRN